MRGILQAVANTIFYLIVIVLVIILGIGAYYRHKSDACFDIARKIVPAYARHGRGGEMIKRYYDQAIRYNPLEEMNYSLRLNSIYLREISAKSD
jgi:Ni,Fe-hydrogenase I cytochrome b subunit